MSGVIQNAKENLLKLGSILANRRPQPDVRFGAVFYRDLGDAEVYRLVPLSRDLQRVRDQISGVQADGGGDRREHLGIALHKALEMSWSGRWSRAVRLIYVVADAPAHNDYDDGFDVASAVREATARRIKIHAIGCHALGPDGEAEFREMVGATGGDFKHLVYAHEQQMARAPPEADAAYLGSSLAIRSFARLGSPMSVLDFAHLGSSLSLKSFARLGSSLAVFGCARCGSVRDLPSSSSSSEGAVDRAASAPLELGGGPAAVADAAGAGLREAAKEDSSSAGVVGSAASAPLELAGGLVFVFGAAGACLGEAAEELRASLRPLWRWACGGHAGAALAGEEVELSAAGGNKLAEMLFESIEGEL